MTAEPRILRVGEELPPMDDDRRSERNGKVDSKASKPKGKVPAGERFKILNAFVDFTLADLSRAEIAVWLILWRDTRDGTARTSMADLARRAGCAKRNVARAVKRLESLRLLNVVHRGGYRRGPTRYRVHPLTEE